MKKKKQKLEKQEEQILEVLDLEEQEPEQQNLEEPDPEEAALDEQEPEQQNLEEPDQEKQNLEEVDLEEQEPEQQGQEEQEEQHNQKKDKREPKKGKKKQKKKKKGLSLSTVILVTILLAGLGIMLYPSVSDWWNSMHATQAIAGYVSAVEDLSVQEKADMLDAARAYNARLSNGVDFMMTEEELEEYESLLNINGTGIMGYVQISAIGVNLPIYHSVDEGVLQIAIGHVPGSSLPVGGERTHEL